MPQLLAFVLLITASCCEAAATGQGVTPVQRVINLLEKLLEETKEEGIVEADGYDGFACFCKQQADEKTVGIRSAQSDLERYDGQIKKLVGEISSLTMDLGDNNKRAKELEKEMAKAQEVRDKEAAEFQAELQDAREAVSGCEEATEQLMGSRAPGGASLLQHSTWSRVQGKLSKTLRKAIGDGALKTEAEDMSAFTSLLEDLTVGDPNKGFKFHSGAIIDALRKTTMSVKKSKAELEMDGAEKKHTFDMAQAARSRSLKSVQDNIAELEETIAAKEGDKQNNEEAMEKTRNDKAADENFLKALTDECELKASEWDQRSKTRSKELEALTQAVTILKGKVATNYGANKKLNLRASSKQLSFLQLNNIQSATNRRVIRYLSRQARKTKSRILSNLVVRIKADHFKKVRDMIKDLIAKLEADALEESNQKGWCDEQMKEATEKRDESQGDVEEDIAKLSEAKSKIQKLTDEITTLGVELADLQQALAEATEMRDAEKAQNKKTLVDAKAGLEAIKSATQVLKKFYQDKAFVQVQARYVPPNSDASGNTVGDLAPKVAEGEYKGNQDASAAILGLMAVITSDFEGTIAATKQAEKEAAADYDKYKNDSETDIKEKSGLKKSLMHDRTELEADATEYKDDLKEHALLKKEALDELDKLKPACVSTGATYEEKVARREQEIESLKSAYKILDEMDQ